MKKRELVKSQQGFTLIELMIVVGIIGILVSIAAPNFARYQSKARQSEAKIALATIYGGEKSFYSEYNSYMSAMDAIGYGPEGYKRFYSIGWATTHSTPPSGYGGTNSLANYSDINDGTNSCGTSTVLDAGLTGDAQGFTVMAQGCLRNGAIAYDSWNITDQKTISNYIIGL